VHIDITENEPKAVLVLDEKRYYVNDEGTPFKLQSPEDAVPNDLVRIEGLTKADLDPLEKGQRKLLRALELINTYRGHSIATLAALNAVTFRYDGFELNVGAGETSLALGKTGDKRSFDRGVRLLRYLTERGEQAEIIHLDNRARPERVSVRLRDLDAQAPALVGVALRP
jgi:cell division protein FtsQ